MLRDALPGYRTLQAEEEAILPKRRSVDSNEKTNKEVARLKKERTSCEMRRVRACKAQAASGVDRRVRRHDTLEPKCEGTSRGEDN